MTIRLLYVLYGYVLYSTVEVFRSFFKQDTVAWHMAIIYYITNEPTWQKSPNEDTIRLLHYCTGCTVSQ
jgi:hypothetical protein